MAVGGAGIQVDRRGALLCLVASQVANYGESLLGATLQGRPGFEWVSRCVADGRTDSFRTYPFVDSESLLQMNNDVVNVLNITLGALLAMALAVVT